MAGLLHQIAGFGQGGSTDESGAAGRARASSELHFVKFASTPRRVVVFVTGN